MVMRQGVKIWTSSTEILTLIVLLGFYMNPAEFQLPTGVM
jgi:hypothetical protein